MHGGFISSLVMPSGSAAVGVEAELLRDSRWFSASVKKNFEDSRKSQFAAKLPLENNRNN